MDGERRLKRVEEQIFSLLPEWNLRPVVDALQAMRGIALINAVVLVAEFGDFTRFSNPRQLMAYFGLIPGERSSGETVRRGGITKTGNSHARRALVEGAWAFMTA
jgi:transposase